jgi:hypothetical protein
LVRALSREASANPARAAELGSRVIYEYECAAVIDSTLGGTADAKKIADYSTSYHGSEEGIEQQRGSA